MFSFFKKPPYLYTLGESFHPFYYEELKLATNRFSAKRLIGRGGFGNVYKATFVDEQENEVILAVKRLHHLGKQGYEEFPTEVFQESQNHPNLVKIYGYCYGNRGEAILVYEFMNGGNLNVALNDSIAGRLEFSWSNRIKVAQNVASALKFLHENDIIHRDLKSSNVLLDEHFTAKLSDLRLMRVSEEDYRTWVQTRIMGSEAYIDPSYVESGILHQKSDVYAFGVLLFELVTGKRASKGNSSRRGLLLETLETLKMPEVSAADFMDPQLSGDYDKEQAMVLISLAQKCTLPSAKDRPPISQAFKLLTEMMECATPAKNTEGMMEATTPAKNTEEMMEATTPDIDIYDYFDAMRNFIAGSSRFSWSSRIRVAQDLASALSSLQRINFIHSDSKNCTAKLSAADISGVMMKLYLPTWIMRSEQYEDPLYTESDTLDSNSDVHAFGVFLLELLTGKKAKGGIEKGILRSETWKTLGRSGVCVSDFIDPYLEGKYNSAQAMTMCQLALKCTMPHTKDRPSIAEAFEILRTM